MHRRRSESRSYVRGGLTIGAITVIPYIPRFETVNVAFESSAGETVPARHAHLADFDRLDRRQARRVARGVEHPVRAVAERHRSLFVRTFVRVSITSLARGVNRPRYRRTQRQLSTTRSTSAIARSCDQRPVSP